MNNILDDIVAKKRLEVEILKRSIPAREMYSGNNDHECISLVKRLKEKGSSGIIAEFKRRSPSKGWFKPEKAETLNIVMDYQQFGATGISILTDQSFFGGAIDDIQKTRKHLQVPILRKDFILDRIQIHEARRAGADLVLLIAAILSPGEVRTLASEAKSLGMEILLELHDESELGHISDEVDLVGINNRNLKTFAVDMEHSLRLAEKIPPGFVKVAESGIDDIKAMNMFRSAGYGAFLIGEKFMREQEPGKAFAQFVNEWKKDFV